MQVWQLEENRPNQHENSHKLCDEVRHPIVNMMESQWKLIQQHQNLLTILNEKRKT